MAVAAQGEPPLQYWLDVARPIQPRPVGERRARARPPRSDMPPASPQMELRMAAAAPAAAVPAMVPVPAPAPLGVEAVMETAAPAGRETPAPRARPCFVAWLRDQGKSKGAIGELAKAARIDPLFPRNGSADDVRARFYQAGADGDALEALEDAERAYDRAA
jgi:hypothetical protein